jgi:hypothetical protein
MHAIRKTKVISPRLLETLAAAALLSGCHGELVSDSAAPGAPSDLSGAAGSTSGGNLGDSPVSAADCKDPSAMNAGIGRWRRLTASQYRNTVEDLLGVEPDIGAFLHDSKTGSFSTNAELPAQSADIDHYQASAEKLARAAASNLPALLGCDPARGGEEACAAGFIDSFGRRAYRHALSASERSALDAVYRVGRQESFAKGIELVIEAALQAPQFLYVLEFGKPAQAPLFELDAYELASRLSYLFWNSAPDTELFAKAESGALLAPEELSAQARRLMQSERFLESAISFHSQLFRVERLSQPGVVSKDPLHTPEFGDALAGALIDETASFVRHLFGSGGGSVRSLLTSKVGFPQAELLDVYGLSSPPTGDRLDVTDGSRSGILTLPAVMAAVPPIPTRHQAVMRGNLIRQELLCSVVPPPNVAVNFELPPNADQLSNQELLRVHKDNPSCAGCHELMDPIGFAFETYDAVGRYASTTPQGDAIDSTGYVEGLDGNRVNFANAAELSEKLATSPSVRSCIARQWFRFALARDPRAGDECSLAAMDQVLTQGDGDLSRALLALVTSSAFRHRKGP